MQLTASWLFALWGLLLATRPAPCGEEHFVAYPNRSIQLAQIRAGNKLVFEYVCQTKGFRTTIARDVGVRHAVTFEADPESHAFYLKDEQLERAKVMLSRHCRCKPLAYDHLEGTLEGRRTASGPWEITIRLAAVDAQGKEVVKFSSTGTYRLQ
jgi:hypothetical protein